MEWVLDGAPPWGLDLQSEAVCTLVSSMAVQWFGAIAVFTEAEATGQVAPEVSGV